MIHARRQKRAIVIDKRKEILNSAIDHFARNGYSRANIKEIAEKAGVATGTVYLYFKNKDDLLVQSMKAMMELNLEKIKQKVAEVEPAIDRLFMFFYHHIEVFTHRPSMARFLVVELRQSEEFYKRYPSYNPYHDYSDYIMELVSKAIQEGTTIAYNPQTVAFIIMGAMDSVLTNWLINPESVNLEEVTHEIRAILRHGIRKDKGE